MKSQSELRNMQKKVLIIAEPTMLGEFVFAFLQDKFKDFIIIHAASMKNARGLLNCISFDIVLAEIIRPDSSVIAMIKDISTISPNTKCMVLSAEANAACVNRALNAGACAFITKSCGCEEIVKAIDAVVNGKQHLSSDVVLSLSEHTAHAQTGSLHGALSPREFEIFVQIGQGKSLKSISDNLNLSTSTIAVHKFNIAKKIGIKSIAKIAHYCIQHGILPIAA